MRFCVLNPGGTWVGVSFANQMDNIFLSTSSVGAGNIENLQDSVPQGPEFKCWPF